MESIYIAFVDTTGFFAFLIRKYLKQRYIHVVLAMDENLMEAYSIGRRNPAVPLFAGMEREDKNSILHKFPDAYYRICELNCTAEQKRQIKERLALDYRRRFHIHYAVLGLFFLVFKIPFYVKDQFTCSSYIAKVLEENGIVISEKHFSLITPKDFLEKKEMKVIFEGPLAEITADEWEEIRERSSV